MPIYYVNRILKAAELNYTLIEKASFTLIIKDRRLRPYFQAHTIVVRANLPQKKALGSPTTSGRMINWSVKLNEYDVQFEPKTTIKAQALADFLIELSTTDADSSLLLPVPLLDVAIRKETKAFPSRKHSTPEHDLPEFYLWWLLKVDESSGDGGSGARVILRGPDGSVNEYSIAFRFSASNNKAECEALSAELRAALAIKADSPTSWPTPSLSSTK